jgi:regulator of replication initiation timing
MIFNPPNQALQALIEENKKLKLENKLLKEQIKGKIYDV